MWNAHHKFKMLIVYLFMCFTLTACPPISPEEIKDLLPTITKIERLGFEFRAFGSPIEYEVNWCGGTAEYGKDVGQVVKDTVRVNLRLEADIKAQFGVPGFKAIEARIVAEHSREVGQEIMWLNSDRPTVAPGTHVIFIVKISQIWEKGRIFYLHNEAFYSDYEILTGFKSDVVDSRQISCSSARNFPPPTLLPDNLPTPNLFEAFDNASWFSTPSKWTNFSGVCQYGAEGGVGTLRSKRQGYCSFAWVLPQSGVNATLATLGEFGVRVTLAEGQGYMDQGVGLFAQPNWFVVCTLRQSEGSFYAVFEVASVAENNNVYLPQPTDKRSAIVALRGTNEELACLFDGQVIGRVAFSELPAAARGTLTRTITSNRPAGAALTMLDDAYLGK